MDRLLRLVPRSLNDPLFRVLALTALVALLVSPAVEGRILVPLICGGAGTGFDSARQAQLLLSFNTPWLLAFAWLIMIVAMMAPLLAGPLRHVRSSSLPRRRTHAAAALMVGYFAIGLAAGLPLLLGGLALAAALGNPFAAGLAALAAGLVWSASPWSQRARNRAHRVQRIGLTGMAVLNDSLRYGARVGLWCTLACLPWMIVPLFFRHFHGAAMLGVALIILAEDLRGTSRPGWRWPFPLNLLIAPRSRFARVSHA